MPPLLLEIRNLTKRYPGVLALSQVSFSLEAHRVHGLVGENGAGKSTLIKMLAGLFPPDRGEILIEGRTISIASPTHSRSLGIAVVHQHNHLIPDLSVAENYGLRLGYPLGRIGQISWQKLKSEALAATRFFLPSIDILAPARSVSVVEKRLVEIAFALASRPRLLILDEPTAVLPYHETCLLFERIRQFVSDGGSVLLVTHRLDEIFELSGDVTVLRDGQLVWRKQTQETNHEDIIRAMVGRAVGFRRDQESIPAMEILFQVADIADNQTTSGVSKSRTEVVDGHPLSSSLSPTGRESVPKVGEDGLDVMRPRAKRPSFQVHRGEIYGIYGLVGAGQSELCQALFGLRPSETTSIRILGQDIKHMSPRERVQSGLGYLPADRITQGLFYKMSIAENLSVTTLDKLAPRGWIDREAEGTANDDMIQQLRIRTLGPEQGVVQLSGGNQQKVLLGRWLLTHPKMLLLEEPTQGVDVGAKGEIHKIIVGLAKSGVSILLVSSEIPELLALSHRIGIMREGRLVGELDSNDASEDEILRLALPNSEPRVTTESHEVERARPLRARPFHWLLSKREASIGLFIVSLVIVFGITLPSFLTWKNLSDLVTNNAVLLIGALGMTLVIISGGIDISVGAILGLSAIAAGKADQAGMSAPVIACAALLVGLGLGILNGVLSVFGRVHSIVVTLGTLSVFRGAIILITGGYWLNDLSPAVTIFGRSKPAGVPVLLLVGLIVASVSHLFLKYVTAARRLYALGGDRASAEVLGIYPNRYLPLAFGTSGLLMGLAGLLTAGRFGQVQTNIGSGDELRFIAAAVIGGTHIMGGHGSALGTFLGAMLIGIITQFMGLARVSAFWEGVVVGGMILLALAADVLVGKSAQR